MNKWIFVFLMLAVAKLPAQTNAPVRLGIVSETDETRTAADVLTAQLSSNGRIQLLERDQIEKVYHEQGLSAANRDDLKLGRILGADGLLLLNVVRTPYATNLMTRLIAVKPGVVLTDGSFPWPLKDTTAWAESVATYIHSFLPKLTVLAKDAIPISVVNLRASISSSGEKETERDLKLLTIQRLSQERRLFVLERQKMQLLSNEKELKSDESAFWDGSYLLDGIVDQNGYSKNTVTINARLTPPKGGAPLLFEVSGSRTNLSEVVNRLAAKVTKLLNVHSTVPEWTAANEAEQYYQEAKWALRWGIYPEAQAAADSAWALGKSDLACALVRVKSYLMAAPPDPNSVEQGSFYYSPGKASVWHAELKEISDNHIATIFQTNSDQINYIAVNRLPDSRQVNDALHALDLYYAFGRSSPDGVPKILTKGPGWNDWHNSDWYNLGVEDLVTASRVLQIFNCDHNLRQSIAEKLADLRALARSVANLISESPSVHQSYFVGNRVAVYDELANTIGEDGGRNPNIFTCEAEWGCFWQETPEDCIALYRKLMSSPVFCYIHEKFWFPSEYAPYRLPLPRVVAWKEADRERIPAIWQRFVQKLDTSTNLFLQLEGNALKLADSDSGTAMAESFTNLFKTMFENRDVLVTNNVDILYLDWQTGDLIERMGGDLASATRDSLEHIYQAEYCPKLDAMEQEYRSKTVPALEFLPIFNEQVRYLKNKTPYAFRKFASLFNGIDEDNYSKSQAREILPLLAAYQSNLIAQAKSKSSFDRFKATNDSQWIGFSVVKPVREILNPPAPHLPSRPRIQTPPPAPATKTDMTTSVPTNAPETVTNIIVVNKFYAIPWERLIDLTESERIGYSHVNITAHRCFEGNLVLDFDYDVFVNILDPNGNVMDHRAATGSGIAIFYPGLGRWEVIRIPKPTGNNYFYRTVLWRGELVNCDGGQIRKYDFVARRWKVLKISDGNNYALFVVNGHLYAANGNIIFEITDGGNATRILASTRRRPPVSVLDTQDLGTPTLFTGPDDSLRVCVRNKIFTWVGNDWREDFTIRAPSFTPEITPEGVVFRNTSASYPNLAASVSWLATKSNQPDLCLSQKFRATRNGSYSPEPNPGQSWKQSRNLSPDVFLGNLPATADSSRLYLLLSHSKLRVIANDRNVVTQERVVAIGKYSAELLVFSRGLPSPQKLYLRFSAVGGCPPAAGFDPSLPVPAHAIPTVPPVWMLTASNMLFLGLEKPRNSLPTDSQLGFGYKPGVWLLPDSQLKTAIAEQRQIQRAGITQEKKRALAAAEQHQKVLARQWQDVLTKYDSNHNGRIDPDEKEAALADPVFIKFELDAIDTNHDDRLEAQELAWFDANQNGILDPPEAAGIAAAQKFLAVKLIKHFDQNGDGKLDQNEFAAVFAQNAATGMPGNPPLLEFSMYDRNHNHELDASELQSYLEQYTLLDVRRRIFQIEPREHFFLLTHPRITFKNLLEMCWKGLDRGDHTQPNRQR